MGVEDLVERTADGLALGVRDARLGVDGDPQDPVTALLDVLDVEQLDAGALGDGAGQLGDLLGDA
ncbi:hypothetical protein D3C72_2125560 [compost metagenome]